LRPGEKVNIKGSTAVVLDVATEEYQGILAIERMVIGNSLMLNRLEIAKCEMQRQKKK
jgi:hypothetical protein